MKTFTLLAFLLIAITTTLPAQNWQPLSLTETHHYFSDTANHFPDRSIRIDSVTGNSIDSIWHLTRYMEIIAQDTAIKNRPGFLQRKMRILPGGWYQFRDPGNIALHATATLNQSWLLDTLQSITATVERIWQGTVLGTSDSLKLLRLTGGDSLILSQNHGLLEWPATLGAGHFRLAGLQQLSLGDRYPTFDEWFPYQAGQTFFWESNYAISDISSYYYYRHTKMVIDSVHRDSTGIHVHFSGIQQNGGHSGFGQPAWGPVNPYSGWTFSIYDRDSSVFGRLHHEPWHGPNSIQVYNHNGLGDFRFADVSGSHMGGTALSHYYNQDLEANLSQSDTARILTLGKFTNFTTGNFGPPLSGPMGDTLTNFMLDDCEYRIRSGVGLEYLRHAGFEDIGSAELVGYITLSGDSVGNAWRTWFIVAAEEAMELPVLLYPNPARTETHIIWPTTEAWTLELLDSKGTRLDHQAGDTREHLLNLHLLPAGIYLLWMTQGTQSTHRRIIVTK
jgi:hypothetical protein